MANADVAGGSGSAFNPAVLADDPWVAYQNEPTAFQVQRPHFSDVDGGDFVRGSAAYTTGKPGLPKTATRYHIVPPDSQTLATQSTLVAQVQSYSQVDVTWGFPSRFDDWDDVALVRSCFGHPSTVNDGQVLFLSTRTDYPVDDSDTPLSVVVHDDNLTPGRWCYYTLFFCNVNTEWVAALHATALVPREWGHQDHLWNGVPPYYQWVDARFRSDSGYLRQFLSLFGFELDMIREYVESWQEAYHADFSPIQLIKRVGENLGLPDEQGLGEIRYRALVGQLSELYQRRGIPEGIRRLIETASKYETFLTPGSNMMLLPDDSDFGYGTGNWVVGTGVGGVPSPVTGSAVALGPAFDANVTLSNAQLSRPIVGPGDGVALTASVTIQGTTGPVTATAGIANATGTAYNPVRIDHPIVLIAPYPTSDKQPGYGRGVLRVIVPVEYGTGDVIVTAGLGVTYPANLPPKTLSPKFNGIPIKFGSLYGFTAQYKGPVTGCAGIYWFDKNETFLSSIELLVPSPGEWQAITVQGTPPTGGVFAVPYVRQTARAAGNGFALMGAQFYRVGDVATVAALSPDYYLTLGSGNELIGSGAPANRVIGDG